MAANKLKTGKCDYCARRDHLCVDLFHPLMRTFMLKSFEFYGKVEVNPTNISNGIMAKLS